ncbi:Ger(x)C family spore germination protein [Paenibacillus tarimensis]
MKPGFGWSICDVRNAVKQVLLVFVMAGVLLLTGCWDRTEINDLALVVGVAMDKKDEGAIDLTVELSIPKAVGSGQGGTGGGGGDSETIIRTGTGATLGDAISDVQEKIPRRSFWGHAKVIVIGEKLAREGIREHLDFFARHPQTNLRSFMFVSEGNAKDVMSLLPPLERSSSEVLRELAKSETMMKVTLKNLLRMLVGDARAAALPLVSILPPENSSKPSETIAYINRTAVFRRDKMIGSIDDKLTRGVLWLRNEIRHANVTVRPKRGEGYVSMTLLRANTELVPVIENGKWKMTVRLKTEDDIIHNASNLNLMNPKLVRMLEEDLKEMLERRIELALTSVQKMKADIVGFGEVFHRKYPQEWSRVQEEWEDIFPTVEIRFDSKAEILRPGMSTNPQGLPGDEVKKK